MKKMALIAALAALGLASCTPSSASSSEEPAPTSSEPSPSESSSEESTSSESTESGESSESSDTTPKHDGNFYIEYKDYDLPKGENVSETEYNMILDEIGANQAYLVAYDYDAIEQTSNYELLSEAYGPYRNFEEYTTDQHTDFYQGRIANNVADESFYTSVNGGHYGGYDSYDDYNAITHVDEWVYSYGDADNGYYLYLNYDRTEDGLSSSGTQELYNSDTLDGDWGLNWYYDYMVVYANVYGGLMNWSSAIYDAAHRSYVKDAAGNVYDTNYYSNSFTETFEVGEETISMQAYSISGTQYVYGYVEGIGHCMTQFTTMSLDYVVEDFDGNKFDHPVPYYKRVNTTTISYALEKPVYEGEALAPIVAEETPYDVTLDFYLESTAEDGTVSVGSEIEYSIALSDITSAYKDFYEPDYEGYVYRGYSEAYYGHAKVNVATKVAEGETPAVTSLGWNELTKWSDPYEYSEKDTVLDNGIALSWYVYMVDVKIDLEGNVTAFEISYVREY